MRDGRPGFEICLCDVLRRHVNGRWPSSLEHAARASTRRNALPRWRANVDTPGFCFHSRRSGIVPNRFLSGRRFVSERRTLLTAITPRIPVRKNGVSRLHASSVAESVAQFDDEHVDDGLVQRIEEEITKPGVDRVVEVAAACVHREEIGQRP